MNTNNSFQPSMYQETLKNKNIGKKIFQTRCATCHGANGNGKGPASLTLSPQPRDFTDKNWQNNVDNRYLAKIIQYGGSSVGRSTIMPPNPDLIEQDETIQAIIDYIRSFKK